MATTALLKSIDLFGGAGGMSEGLRQAGFQCVFANDFEDAAVETFRRNHPSVPVSGTDIAALDAGAIRRDLGLKRGQLDLVAGGPPCQGFSTYGKRSPTDLRNQLYVHFFRFIEEFRPKAFAMENVVGILSFASGGVINDIQTRARGLGYEPTVSLLDAADFGVPQYRRRVIVSGVHNGRSRTPVATHGAWSDRKGKQADLFEPSHLSDYITLREAIADLPEEVLPPKETHSSVPYQAAAKTSYQASMRIGSSGILHHSSKRMLGIRRMRLALLRAGDYGTSIGARLAEGPVPREVIDEVLRGSAASRDIDECRTEDRAKELALRELLQRGATVSELREFLDSGGFANKYRRLSWDSPSHTVVAHMARDCSDFVHPETDRFVSVREAARIQSFPDRYIFLGSQFHQFRQIGNALPPLLGRAIGRAVIADLGFGDASEESRVPSLGERVAHGSNASRTAEV